MHYLRLAETMIFYTRARAREARAQGRSQIGASAVEWAVISAVVVTLAAVIWKVIENVVTEKSQVIEQESNGG